MKHNYAQIKFVNNASNKNITIFPSNLLFFSLNSETLSNSSTYRQFRNMQIDDDLKKNVTRQVPQSNFMNFNDLQSNYTTHVCLFMYRIFIILCNQPFQ